MTPTTNIRRPFLIGLLVALFALAGIAVLASSQTPVWHDWILDRESVRTTAVPFSVEPTDVAKRYRGTIYAIQLQYADEQQRPHVIEIQTYKTALIQQAQRRVPMNIEYSPAHPEIARLVGERASSMGLPLVVIAIVMVLTALIWFATKKLVGMIPTKK